jgi:polyhydroxybutyrate depolymerase
MNYQKILISCFLFCLTLQIPLKGANDQLKDNEKTYFLQIQNTNRSYLVHLPKSYTNNQYYPLVLVLHGRGGSGPKMAEYTQFSELADKQKFIVVYPNAINKPTLWNAFYKPYGKERDDITFISKTLQQLKENYKINERKIYVVGYSSGAMMAYRVASELSSQITAVAIISGSLGYRKNNRDVYINKPTVSIPTIIVHGKKDPIVHFKGGMSLTVKTDLIGVKPSVEKWAAYNQCKIVPTKENFISSRYIRETYTCINNGQIVFYTLLDGTHKWPTLLPNENNQMSLTAQVLWDFLSKYQK